MEVERALLAGELACPACGGELRPWSHARTRVVRRGGGEQHRRPRRGRCGDCGVTHVLICDDSLVRRRDGIEVIGAALAARARGQGHRSTALLFGVPASTLRGWLRRFKAAAEAIRVWFTVLAHDLDPMLEPLAPAGSVFGDAVEAIAVAARAGALRLGSGAPWSFASTATAGRLLSNTNCPWEATV